MEIGDIYKNTKIKKGISVNCTIITVNITYHWRNELEK